MASLCALRVPRDDCAPRCLPLPARALLYAPAYVCAPADAPDVLDVHAAGDRVLGAALCAGAPLLFTRQHGVLRLRLAPDDAERLAPCVLYTYNYLLFKKNTSLFSLIVG